MVSEVEIRTLIREIGDHLLAYAKAGPQHPDEAIELVERLIRKVDSKAETADQASDEFEARGFPSGKVYG